MRLAIAAAVLPLCLVAQTVDKPVNQVDDPGVVTTGQKITPAGVPTVFHGRVFGAAFTGDGASLWVLNATQLYQLDWKANRVLANIAHRLTPGLQAIRWDAKAGAVTIAGSGKGNAITLARANDKKLETIASSLGQQLAGAFGFGGGKVVVPLVAQNRVVVVDAGSGKTLGTVEVPVAPFAASVNAAGTVAWVSNWGGRAPTAKDITAPTGLAKNSDRVVIDARGVASTGTVSRVDLATMKVTAVVNVELHPTALAWDEAAARLYVANTNRDSISVIDTNANRVVRTIAVQPFARKAAGIAPTAMALSKNGKRLWVACGGINAVAQMDVATGKMEGLIPTAWYPNSVVLSPDEKRLAVTSLLGAGSGWRDEPKQRFVHTNRGAVSVIELPDAAQLAAYTTATAENNRMRLAPEKADPARKAAPKAIPVRAGDPSLIEHVVYIVKENRTYDQVFGAIGKGNSDPSLVMFGEDVTPNHHRLARDFTLLDNFYATGGNSADGHQWLTQANETAYCLWPGYRGRSYPFDGTDPIAPAAAGFLWDYALARQKSVQVFGEYVPRVSEASKERIGLLKQAEAGTDFSKRWNVVTPIPSLNKILVHDYPSYSNSVPDQIRAQIFLRELKRWEAEGKMPNLVIAAINCDHTFGTSPGASSPKAMVADNDLALGRMVDALSHSKFWPKMAIFVVEDDAQNGVDHVDGHRTVALAISPYTRRGIVDSTFYSHQSMLKTMELILGLPTMSLFDLIATDMRASFSDRADARPYTHVRPKQDLYELNPPAKALSGAARRGALASARMRWDVPDAVPSDQLNRILWHSIRGWNVPYPGTRKAVFSPLSLDIDDDER